MTQKKKKKLEWGTSLIMELLDWSGEVGSKIKQDNLLKCYNDCYQIKLMGHHHSTHVTCIVSMFPLIITKQKTY